MSALSLMSANCAIARSGWPSLEAVVPAPVCKKMKVKIHVSLANVAIFLKHREITVIGTEVAKAMRWYDEPYKGT